MQKKKNTENEHKNIYYESKKYFVCHVSQELCREPPI